MGLAFLTAGVAFKIAAVPFHYWTPDAYQGSPTPVTGYLSVGPKVGAFALVIRLFGEALWPLAADWNIVIMVLAALTMTLGNLVALTQDNVKRMLAYSSIAHTGYMLVGFAAFGAGQIQGLEGLLYYSAAYAFMNLGAFGGDLGAAEAARHHEQPVHVRGPHPPRAEAGAADDPVPAEPDGHPADGRVLRQVLRDPRGGQRRAVGLPARWRMMVLAVLTVLNAAVAAFYYLRVVVYMFMREPTGDIPVMPHGRLVWTGLAVTMVLTILLGFFPSVLLDIVGTAAAAIG